MKINLLLCLLMASLAASKPLVNDEINEVDGNEVEETPPHEPRDQECILNYYLDLQFQYHS